MVYIQDTDAKKAYFGSYNKKQDDYTKQIFGEDFTKTKIENVGNTSKYKTRFILYKEAVYKNISSANITKQLDTVIG
ncbi:MAG: hypothetical protein JKZ00_06810, partial [Flavobacteriaceae bacterium]|nr:hypothetical protein [Flavobacteriaceae bacterium]